MTNPYEILIKILDEICSNAPETRKVYSPLVSDIPKINYARSRAYIHLYLMVKFGILDFEQREKFVTDGSDDAGIDGYYIDQESKTVFFIQAKFRTTENNFLKKDISVDEILMMETDRILDGENCYESGKTYNGKILGMIRDINSIQDIGRYRYKVIILANLKKVSPSKLKLLSGGLPCDVFGFKKCYTELVFPIITGTYYNEEDLKIFIELKGKTAGSRINYAVNTEYGQCDITVLFAPTLEIGKFMDKYKNSTLKYNPRSFLTLKKGNINKQIRDTIIEKDTNEFALYNNGITILSDGTSFNEKIGKKQKAQLIITNPQIINGGQTAYTLSIIFNEAIKNEISPEERFGDKEVLLRIITLKNLEDIPKKDKLKLIEDISKASNSQNAVSHADRMSNHIQLIDVQKKLFETCGFLVERKKGEFYDGIQRGFVSKKDLIDRTLFFKIAYATQGNIYPSNKAKRLLAPDKLKWLFENESIYNDLQVASLIYSKIKSWIFKKDKIVSENIKSHAIQAIIAVCIQKLNLSKTKKHDEILENIINQWEAFENYAESFYHNRAYFKFDFIFSTKSYKVSAKFDRYYVSPYLANDLNNFFFERQTVLLTKHDNDKLPTLGFNSKRVKAHWDTIKKVYPLLEEKKRLNKGIAEEIAKKLNIPVDTVNQAGGAIISNKLGYYIFMKYQKEKK